jgi:hypothetical protein
MAKGHEHRDISHLLRLAKLKMHLTSANVWCLAAVDTPIGCLPWKMRSRRSSNGAYGKQGLDSLDMGCRPVVSRAAYLGPVWSELSSTYLIILAHNDQGG